MVCFINFVEIMFHWMEQFLLPNVGEFTSKRRYSKYKAIQECDSVKLLFDIKREGSWGDHERKQNKTGMKMYNIHIPK